MHGRDSTDMGTAHGLEFESCPIVLTIFLVTFVLLADKGNLLARNCVKIVLPATALFFIFIFLIRENYGRRSIRYRNSLLKLRGKLLVM